MPKWVGGLGRSALCVLVVLLLCLVSVAGQARAQTTTTTTTSPTTTTTTSPTTGIKIVKESVVWTRTSYPSVRPSEGPVQIYAGEWTLTVPVHNYDVGDLWYSPELYCAGYITMRVFLDNVLTGEYPVGYSWSNGTDSIYGILKGDTSSVNLTLSMIQLGDHEILIQIWHGTETQPQDTYSFNVTVVGVKLSGLQASSKVVRALGDNSLAVSFTNSGNENARQAVLSVSDNGGLTITPSEVELGDVNSGENVSANFTVSSPASVTLGTTQVRFSLSFIDYADVPHTENVYGEVEVYRLASALTLSAPGTAENGSTVEITAALKDPNGNPIPNENIALSVDGAPVGSSETDSSGVAQVSYNATGIGTHDISMSFSGSASYASSSDSAVLTVTPSTSATTSIPPTSVTTSSPSTSTPPAEPFPYWILLVVVLALLVGSIAYLAGRRMGRRPSGPQARKNRHDG
jgi:hypothetical protein